MSCSFCSMMPFLSLEQRLLLPWRQARRPMFRPLRANVKKGEVGAVPSRSMHAGSKAIIASLPHGGVATGHPADRERRPLISASDLFQPLGLRLLACHRVSTLRQSSEDKPFFRCRLPPASNFYYASSVLALVALLGVLWLGLLSALLSGLLVYNLVQFAAPQLGRLGVSSKLTKTSRSACSRSFSRC